jgi:hypothetical protein
MSPVMDLVDAAKRVEAELVEANAAKALLAQVRAIVAPPREQLTIPALDAHPRDVVMTPDGLAPAGLVSRLVALEDAVRNAARMTCVREEAARDQILDVLGYIVTGYGGMVRAADGFRGQLDNAVSVITKLNDTINRLEHELGEAREHLADAERRAGLAAVAEKHGARLLDPKEPERDALAAEHEERTAQLTAIVDQLRAAGRIEAADFDGAVSEVDGAICGLLEDLDCAKAPAPTLGAKHLARIKLMAADRRGLKWDHNAADLAAFDAVIAAFEGTAPAAPEPTAPAPGGGDDFVIVRRGAGGNGDIEWIQSGAIKDDGSTGWATVLLSGVVGSAAAVDVLAARITRWPDGKKMTKADLDTIDVVPLREIPQSMIPDNSVDDAPTDEGDAAVPEPARPAPAPQRAAAVDSSGPFVIKRTIPKLGVQVVKAVTLAQSGTPDFAWCLGVEVKGASDAYLFSSKAEAEATKTKSGVKRVAVVPLASVLAPSAEAHDG